ncbi:hypothetical protein MPDQ_006405 [Monascus purpureus]|uniref:Ino eighty subunit 1 n=1 Tax=Monascus purpureus TaxID=5098 RepID=A0A507QWK1_MONPU|nr:hypothetical protein MPDQ_006405 [Monascus purpureus]BDD56462.1 hypothetical protein MAP00_001918 [Monascus purpureus]
MVDIEGTSVAEDPLTRPTVEASHGACDREAGAELELDQDQAHGQGDGNENDNDNDQDPCSTHNTTASATVGTRRQTNGTIGSVYSGNKIRHLKKEDGIPLWRKDIQFEFLKLVFEDQTPVFTRYSDGARNVVFADIYLDAMARSSKTSKVLKDKLQSDRQAAIGMAMVCLLVNVGRMNTTLNFFPEMRAQLRTYHPIPSLQAHQEQNTDKQLQDAPRLKSILKGASEDTDQPNTLERIKRLPVPRTNPVNLIFVLAQYAPKVSEIHFFPPRDFFDLVVRSTLSSRSRARAFLWLMWWYLESDFSRGAALNNPFGPGLDGEGTEGLPIKVPVFESLTEEQANEENIDTPSEIEYGESKRLERKRILEEDEPTARLIKRPKKDSGYDEDQVSGDLASVRGDRISLGGFGSAVSTPLHPSLKRSAEDEEDERTPGQSARARSNKKAKRDPSANSSAGQQRLILKTKMEQTPDTASPAPPGSGHPILNQFEPPLSQPVPPAATTSTAPSSSRRPRPLTQHQLAVEQNRRQRVEYMLAKRKNEEYSLLRKKRESEFPFARYARLLQGLPDGYDTEDEEHSWGKGGLIPNPLEEEDFGECASYYLSVIRKAARRLDRWDYEGANGPKRDRKKEREERAKRRLQNGLSGNGKNNGFSNTANSNSATLETGSIRATPSRSKGKAPRSSAKRKSAAGSTVTPNKKQASSSARSKGGRARTGGRSGTGAAGIADSTTNSLDVPSHGRGTLSPLGPSAHADADVEIEGDDGLDDIDKELLGEGTGDEGDETHHRPASTSRSHPPRSRAAHPSFDESGIDDSFLADDDNDNEPLTSENEVELGSDIDMEEGNSDAASSLSSSPARDIVGKVEPEAEALADDDDLM